MNKEFYMTVKKRGMLNIMESSVWGGMEQYVYDMSEELKRQGIAPFVLTDIWKPEFISKYSEVATVFSFKIRKNKGFYSIHKMAALIRQHNIDTILCHTGKYIFLAILLKKMTGAKVVFFKHNVLPAKTDIYHRWIQNQVDAFVCVSKCVYDAQVVKGKEYKYHLIYNGINTNRFPNIEVEKKKDVFVVGYAGRIGLDKGIIELLDAIKYLHKLGKPIELYMCGKISGNSDDIIHTHIRDNHMESYVNFLGFQNDMNHFYKSIHCLVVPSKIKEAFGLVICESMYCKTPVITSNSGAQEEIITNGENGIIIDTVDYKNIADSITYLMDNPSEYQTIVNNGYKRVVSTFTIKEMVESIKYL